MPKTFVLECPENCSLRAGTAVGFKVSEWLVEKVPYRKIIRLVKAEDDYTLYPGTLTRHKKHIVVTGRENLPDDPEALRHQATNIEILETIIQKGFQNQKNWKPTISDTMKAMDMWFRLTQGNPFDDLLNTLASASIGEDLGDEEVETNPDALGTVAETEIAPDDAETADIEAMAPV